ncbi:MAG TPA: glycosyltransferase family 2 protein [Candidatus Limnocylindria bacterium]|jgi:glycosyltransferase involved in cell wall biosynthesis|nr:glycosyltransferase family 2 protein [Candidatus Limnocylindria bacterium]
MERHPISVCLISGAEAHRIERALASVHGWVQEIVVVLNAEVTDGTDQIAERHGAKVFREPWKGYIQQKNSAASKATQPWILGIDSDEVVSPELQATIIAAVAREKAQPRFAAYQFPRCSRYFGGWVRHGDWYPDWSKRLWRSGQARWAGDEPHDFLQVDGEVGRLSGDLYHYSMDSIEHQIQKTIRYADVFAAHCQKHGRAVRWSDLFSRPILRFVRSYVIKLGFLDGWRGYAVAFMISFYTFLRYFKALQAQGKIKLDRE